MEQAVEFKLSCPGCDQAVVGWQGQQLHGDSNRIQWFSEWQCSSCGLVSDDFGDGPGPDSLRNALIDKFGGAAIAVTSPGVRIVAMKELRELLDITPVMALSILTGSDKCRSMVTRVESEAVVHAVRGLGHSGEDIKVVRICERS